MAENSAETLDVPVPSTKITDVNIDCLEKICNYLSFEDLLSVADVHTHLRKAADLMYGLKYGNKIVFISSMEKGQRAMKVGFNGYNRMFIYAFKTLLKTIRCFGHNILRIDMHGLIFTEIASFIHLVTYIGEYCADQLKSLEFMVTSEGVLKHLKKPLLGVQKLIIWENGLTTHFLNEFFPNLKHLMIIYGHHVIQNVHCVAVDFANIEKYFPYLNQMKINSDYSANRYSLATRQRTESVFDVVQLKNTKQFGEHKSSSIRLPLDHLEEICLEIHFENDDNFYDFFSKYPSITNLSLTQPHHSKHKFEEKDLNVSKLANTLPWLEQIDLSCCKFTPSVAIQWMDQFKSLEKFRFYFEFQSECIDLQTRLGSEWQSNCIIDGNKHMCDLIRNHLQTD